MPHKLSQNGPFSAIHDVNGDGLEDLFIGGASGQIGTELVMNLRSMYGNAHVVASDVKSATAEVMESGPFEQLDIMDESRLQEILDKYKVTQIDS